MSVWGGAPKSTVSAAPNASTPSPSAASGSKKDSSSCISPKEIVEIVQAGPLFHLPLEPALFAVHLDHPLFVENDDAAQHVVPKPTPPRKVLLELAIRFPDADDVALRFQRSNRSSFEDRCFVLT